MSNLKQVKLNKVYMGKLEYGSDLLDAITKFCLQNKIKLGRLTAIGAVQKAALAYYEQKTYQYLPHIIDQPLEIVSLLGNISLKDDKPMVHAHIVLSDKNGRVFAGHVAQGTRVFACEIIIENFSGPDFVRGFDEKTRLPLWDMPE